jgi:hypothetical protein
MVQFVTHALKAEHIVSLRLITGYNVFLETS